MKYIKSFSDTSALQDYLDTSAGFGTFVFEDRSKEYEDSIVYVHRELKDYLTFTAQQANSRVQYISTTNTTAEYSTDGGVTWTNAVGIHVTLTNVGDSVKYRGVISGNISTTRARFDMSGKIAASGSIMSMYNNNPNDVVITSYYGTFKYMFKGCTSLTVAPELPATTLSESCYVNMFEGCTSLTVAPELPATTLASYCYNSMFNGCTSLTVAPELPAMTLAQSCYSYMFQNCSSLTTAPELPATSLPSQTYPYSEMFYGCTSLTSVTHHITSWDTSYTKNWLNGVAASGTVYCPSNSTIPADSNSGIPTGWARVNI